jgi:hypothetical protein
LKEPNLCTIIPTIEEEKKEMDANNDGLPKKPVETYLDNCRNFARSNLRKKAISIDNYVFNK